MQPATPASPAAAARPQLSALEQLRGALPDYARDLKLNLGSVLSAEGAPGLSEPQRWAIAIAAAIASRNGALARELEAAAVPALDAPRLQAARAAAAVMAMNNVYYRFVHLVGNPDYERMPARLRMNVLANPGIPREDFELLALAVSAVNGCGKCLAAHERALREQGASAEAIQSAVRIAAVIYAVATVGSYELEVYPEGERSSLPR
jgi:alkyl hydroperoxide reductase subunit D